MSSAKLLLFDTASVYFRAFYALPSSMKSLDGRQVNAVRGLLDFVAKFVSESDPTHIACCWDDAWRPDWRVALVPSYKAHRVDAAGGGAAEETPDALDGQVPLIRDVLASLGIAVVGAADYEADDVIGTLTSNAHMAVEIVTGDRDLFQLVSDDDDVAVRYVGAGMKRSHIVTDEWLMDTYGITGAQYADFALLRGDPSDGLPGVAGVGDKTAASLVSSFGDLEGIVSAVDAGRVSPRVAGKIAQAVDYLAAARDVVRVCRTIPGLPATDRLIRPTAPARPEHLAVMEHDLALGSSGARIRTALWPAGVSD